MSSAPLPAQELPKVARIALFTVRAFAIEHAIKVIQARPDAELACVVTSPGPKARRSDAHVQVVEALYKFGYATTDVIVTNKRSKWADLIALYDANLILCSGFPWLLPESLLNDSRLTLGVINFHNSLLPQYMGPNAFGWSIVNGDGQVGYCAHRMGSDFDTGPVLLTETVPLDINEDYQDLKKKVPAVFSRMVDQVITLALAGDPGKAQTGTASYAPKFDDAFRWVDFTDTALETHNKVRAFYGERDHPKGALAKVDGETLCFTKTRLHHQQIKLVNLPQITSTPGPSSSAGNADDMASLTSTSTISNSTFVSAATGTKSDVTGTESIPGTMLTPRIEGEAFFVQCGDTSLEVLEWHKVE